MFDPTKVQKKKHLKFCLPVNNQVSVEKKKTGIKQLNKITQYIIINIVGNQARFNKITSNSKHFKHLSDE